MNSHELARRMLAMPIMEVKADVYTRKDVAENFSWQLDHKLIDLKPDRINSRLNLIFIESGLGKNN